VRQAPLPTAPFAFRPRHFPALIVPKLRQRQQNKFKTHKNKSRGEIAQEQSRPGKMSSLSVTTTTIFSTVVIAPYLKNFLNVYVLFYMFT